jgi:hypothetical protein
MGKYRKILITYDGSNSAKNALRQACRLAKVDKSWLKLMLVIPQYDGDLELIGISNIKETIEGPYQKILVEAREIANFEGVNLLTNLTQGEPYEKIVDVAEDENCDLIIMGRKGRSHVERALIGGVTARVIGHTKKDVLVVPGRGVIDWGHLLVATDGSPCSQAAVDMALDVAKIRGSRVSVISVAYINDEYFALAPEQHNQVLKETAQLLDDIKQNGSEQGIELNTAIREGEPFKGICEYADHINASMIVLGSHGRKGLTRLLMGSVTEHVVGLANVPVIVTHL